MAPAIFLFLHVHTLIRFDMLAANLRLLAAEENALIGRARRLLAVYEEMAELIRLGAYRHGTDAEVDEAIRLYPKLEAFLGQARDERSTLADSYAALVRILSGAPLDQDANGAR